jgi:hypothetical protein
VKQWEEPVHNKLYCCKFLDQSWLERCLELPVLEKILLVFLESRSINLLVSLRLCVTFPDIHGRKRWMLLPAGKDPLRIPTY